MAQPAALTPSSIQFVHEVETVHDYTIYTITNVDMLENVSEENVPNAWACGEPTIAIATVVVVG